MEKSSIIHRADKEFCFALSQEKFMVRIHTKKDDCRGIVLHYTDKYLTAKKRGENYQCTMTKVATDECRDYYEAEISFQMICMRYYFELLGTDGTMLFYGNDEFFKEPIESLLYMFDCPQQQRVEDRFDVPEWVAGKVAYQIFVDRFYKKDMQTEAAWYKSPMKGHEKFYGNLQGIAEKLDYLKDLGIDIVYLTPIFLADSNHKYDTIDYMQIDPEFGTKEDLVTLVDKAHQLGMYIILDGVFNHTSTKFFAFQDVQEKKEQSAYLDWYYTSEFPLEAKPYEKPNYLTFGYYGGMPKLNCQNEEVRSYIFKVVRYWMEETGIDGWRLDVGDEIGHDFWKAFRKQVRSVNPEAFIVGESWYFAQDYLQGDEWDSIMNYHFKNAVMEFVAKETLSAAEFVNRMEYMRGNAHPAVYQALWNLIDSHDTARFMHEANENKQKQRLAAALQLLYPGTPMLYYGDEAGMSGGPDPDCRRGMLWEPEKRDEALFSYYKALICCRHEHIETFVKPASYLLCEDETGLVVLESGSGSGKLVEIFHGKAGSVDLPQYAGKRELITGKIFDGRIGAFEAAVLEG